MSDLLKISIENFKDATKEELLTRATRLMALLAEENDRLEDGIDVYDTKYLEIRFDMITELKSVTQWFVDRCLDKQTRELLGEWEYRISEMEKVLGDVIRTKAN